MLFLTLTMPGLDLVDDWGEDARAAVARRMLHGPAALRLEPIVFEATVDACVGMHEVAKQVRMSGREQGRYLEVKSAGWALACCDAHERREKQQGHGPSYADQT